MKYHFLGIMRKVLLSIFLFSALFTLSATDYSSRDMWAYSREGSGSVDLFIVAPTVDMGEEGNLNMSLSDEAAKEAFVGALNMERGIFEGTVMYSPFYRQMTFPIYEKMEAEEGEPLEIAYSDVREAFIYYLENLNNGRPFMLAGFSQGGEMILLLMKEFFSDEALQDKLVASYIIGWKITDEDLSRYPQLKMAEGEDDTGVMVSFNTEAPDASGSIIVPEGVRTHGINPLNWKTDETPADKSLNEGACFTDYSGSILEEIPHLTGAYLDSERGTLKAVDINPADYSTPLFPDGIYHLYDYQFFFRNLQSNVETRIAAYLSTAESAA